MKRFLLVALLLVSAASAYAADLKITGDAEVRGVINNAEYDGDTVYKDKFFDADFNFNAALVLTENTTIFTKLTFDAENGEGTATVPDSEAGEAAAMLGVERAYISTKFLPALTVDAGLMGGGMWGTAFGNTETNVTRIKGTYAISDDIKVSAIYEKGYESNDTTLYKATEMTPQDVYDAVYDAVFAATGDATAADAAAEAAADSWTASDTSDFGDTTSYYLTANIKAGAFTIMPLFRYQTKETEVWLNNKAASLGAATKSDAEPWSFKADIAVTGDLGMIGFEAEVIYEMVKWDDFKADDTAIYGAYVDVFAKLEMAKAGVALFYESADKTDGTFAAGTDFDFTLLTEDDSLAGYMGGKLYASEIKIVDKISADVAFAYVMQTNDDVFEDSFFEVDAGVNYAIDAATTYTIEGGYIAGTEKDAGTDYDYNMYMVRHKFAVKF